MRHRWWNAVASGLLALLGAIPGASGRPLALATLVWIALLAFPIGAWHGARRERPLATCGITLAIWAAVLGGAQALARHPLPDALPGLAACAVLLALGAGAGSLAGTRPGTALAAAALLVLALFLLPRASSIQREPWPRAVRARLLDLSPASVAAEWAGVDWMRHPSVYESSGTVDFDPATRSAHHASLAGGLAFVVGCAATWLGGRAARGASRPPA